MTAKPPPGAILQKGSRLAAIGDGRQFGRARDLAAWLGLVPREHSTGGKTTLLGISKRGNRYVRRLLIHGARSCVTHLDRTRDRLGGWLNALQSRMHVNKVTVALAAQRRQFGAGLRRQRLPSRCPLLRAALRLIEQIEMPAGAWLPTMTLVIVSHGSLSDSGRESTMLRPEPGHSMVRRHRPDSARYRSTADAGLRAQPEFATGALVERVSPHAARSNIHTGSSNHRLDGSPPTQQRKTSPPSFSITS